MPYEASLLATIVISLAFAYAAGLASRLLRLPPLVGYLAAGIIVGPYTPGFIADQKLTTELAEIGVALLLFSVGLHFSIRDLIAVWHIAVPGALLQTVLSAAGIWPGSAARMDLGSVPHFGGCRGNREHSRGHASFGGARTDGRQAR